MDLNIREMTIGDYSNVINLWRATEGVGLSTSDLRGNIEAYLIQNEGFSFVAEEDGRIIGAVLCGHDGRRGFIHHLAVAHKHRRDGIGRMLEIRCMNKLRSMGIIKCHLLVYKGNIEAQEFWQSLGWEERVDLVIMSKTIGDTNVKVG
jgi:ribosomal protein S18 acetylase RimI-like enzyme